MNTAIKVLLSGAIVLIAVGVVLYKYWDYVTNPWTRDGQVRAQVIQINPRISGPLVKLPIVDNQQVKAGDLLFVIDPRTYQSDVDEAKAALAQATVEVDEARDLADRAVKINKQNVGAISERSLIAKQNSLRNAQNASTKAQAHLDGANLNLEFTEVRAPVDGYVTHLKLRLGSQAVANQPALALVDVNSYWVDAYFRENYIAGISPGDRAIVTLMSYPDRPLEGRVDSHGWGISQDDGTTANDLLPSISATFEWIRLAQRVPVVVHLLEVPDDVKLLVGTTASVLVMTGTHGDESKEPVPATPRALQ
jgi:multidrug resistance efflux pump